MYCYSDEVKSWWTGDFLANLRFFSVTSWKICETRFHMGAIYKALLLSLIPLCHCHLPRNHSFQFVLFLVESCQQSKSYLFLSEEGYMWPSRTLSQAVPASHSRMLHQLSTCTPDWRVFDYSESKENLGFEDSLGHFQGAIYETYAQVKNSKSELLWRLLLEA